MKDRYKNYIANSSFDAVTKEIKIDNIDFPINNTVIFYGNAKVNSGGISIVSNKKEMFYIPNKTQDIEKVIDLEAKLAQAIIDLATSVPAMGAPLNPAVATQVQALKVEIEKLKEELT